MPIRIALNQEASVNDYPRYTNSSNKKTLTNGAKASNGHKDPKLSTSPVSPRDPSALDGKPSPSTGPGTPVGRKSRAGLMDGTVRFMLDAERAREEKRIVDEYFKIEEEEYEVEVERERRRG